MHLTLLSRTYCHLCDEMDAALRRLVGTTPLIVIDIDAPEHAELERRYGDAVPVLFAGDAQDGRELCRFRLDERAVVSSIRSAAGE